MATTQKITFELRGEYITLDKLIKANGLAGSGGGARVLITDGLVEVDGRQELRKTAKIRAGQFVSVQGTRIKVVADPAGEGAAPEEIAENGDDAG